MELTGKHHQLKHTGRISQRGFIAFPQICGNFTPGFKVFFSQKQLSVRCHGWAEQTELKETSCLSMCSTYIQIWRQVTQLFPFCQQEIWAVWQPAEKKRCSKILSEEKTLVCWSSSELMKRFVAGNQFYYYIVLHGYHACGEFSSHLVLYCTLLFFL